MRGSREKLSMAWRNVGKRMEGRDWRDACDSLDKWCIHNVICMGHIVVDLSESQYALDGRMVLSPTERHVELAV